MGVRDRNNCSVSVRWEKGVFVLVVVLMLREQVVAGKADSVVLAQTIIS